jgi:hypothetical protein
MYDGTCLITSCITYAYTVTCMIEVIDSLNFMVITMVEYMQSG